MPALDCTHPPRPPYLSSSADRDTVAAAFTGAGPYGHEHDGNAAHREPRVLPELAERSGPKKLEQSDALHVGQVQTGAFRHLAL
jgi:hypothetical protein